MKMLICALFTILSFNASALGLSVKAPNLADLFTSSLLQDRIPASIKNSIRTKHAKELMGKHYNDSVVNYEGSNYRFEKSLEQLVEKQLPQKWKHLAKKVSETVMEEGVRYRLDPLFIMAIIQNESSFNPSARGTSGEIGLMQIMPNTGKWLSKKFKMKWNGKRSLRNPSFNIKLGTAYISMLREKYRDYGRLYMAAYNMGPGNVKKALKRRIIPKDYTKAVMKRYLDLYETVQKDLI